jgi:hypothetical protein
VVPSSPGREEWTRTLQQQKKNDGTCYTNIVAHHDEYLGFGGDDSGTVTGVPCTSDILGACNNRPSCAVTQGDAVDLASQFCSTWAVWNNGKWYCKWEYMCCNVKEEEEEEEEPEKM